MQDNNFFTGTDWNSASTYQHQNFKHKKYKQVCFLTQQKKKKQKLPARILLVQLDYSTTNKRTSPVLYKPEKINWQLRPPSRYGASTVANAYIWDPHNTSKYLLSLFLWSLKDKALLEMGRDAFQRPSDHIFVRR